MIIYASLPARTLPRCPCATPPAWPDPGARPPVAEWRPETRKRPEKEKNRRAGANRQVLVLSPGPGCRALAWSLANRFAATAKKGAYKGRKNNYRKPEKKCLTSCKGCANINETGAKPEPPVDPAKGGKEMEIGTVVKTPRFLDVKIAAVYDNIYAADEAGYRESTHYRDDPEWAVYGKWLGENRMTFAAVRKA